MMTSLENVKPRDLFGAVDLDGSGYIDRDELAAVCDLDAQDLAEVFDRLDADKDGRISIEEFSENFKKFKSVVSGVKRKKSELSSCSDGEFEDLKDRLGQQFNLLSGQEYVSELFHYLHSSTDSPQLLALLESFLFSVVRDVKHYASENQRLEEALKRTCEKHTEHMDQLDSEMEQHMQRMETRIRQEERSKQERSNLDIVWQLETKTKEIQTLTARIQKLEGRLKRKEPEEQKIKEEVDEKVQEIRFLRSQLTDAQTNLAVLRSELAQLRSDYEEQEAQLVAEKRTVMECVQEQESLTRQLQLLHEANKKLHDTNDDLRAALEVRKNGDKRSPSPSKKHSISTLYSPTSSLTRNGKSPVNSWCSPGFAEDLTPAESVDGKPEQATPLRAGLTRTPYSAGSSRRGSALLPTQQSCEVDDETIMNENSLMTELMQVQQLSVPEDIAEEESEKELDYNNNAGILNSRETGQIHHLIPPAKQTCEVDDPISTEDKCLFDDEPVILGYCTMNKPKLTTDCTASVTSDDTEQSDASRDTDTLLRESKRFSSRFGKYFGKLSKSAKNRGDSKMNEKVKEGAVKRIELRDSSFRKSEPRNTAVKKGEAGNSALKKNDSKDFGLKKNDGKKGKNYLKRRGDGNVSSKLESNEGSVGRDTNPGRGKIESITPEFDSDSEEAGRQFKECAGSRRSKTQVGAKSKLCKNPSVTFSSTVTCSSDNRHAQTSQKTKNFLNKRTLPLSYLQKRHVMTSETSDTDSTTQELQTNFHRELAEEDEAYSTMKSSERKTWSKQLDILQETNKRLCESNDDLRAALEALTSKRLSSMKSSKARRSGEKCHRNPSVHSDYGSISSRSITPNHLQGPKSEDDVGDGAEAVDHEPDELSGYEPESDVNTMTINAHHFEAAPKLSKLAATPHDRHVTLQEHTNDVMWESDAEHEPDPAQPTAQQTNVERNANNLPKSHSPFDRNSHLRKPCRHKSLEHLFNKSNGKGDRSAWPAIARAGKWNSLEQVRRRNDFIGERTRSLPTSRAQSEEGANFGKGIGVWPLSEKLRSLRSSRETMSERKDDSKDSIVTSSHNHAPVMRVIRNLNTEIETVHPEDLDRFVTRPDLGPTQRKISEETLSKRLVNSEENKLFPDSRTDGYDLKRSNSLVIKRSRAKTDSLPESETSRAADAQLSAELEAQFKSVIEEDDEDIDEDDVADEELAQLVAMETALTESEEDTDTETEAPEGERGAAVGSDSTSEASTNTPMHVSTSENSVPERMYKLVLAGDAAVGKSSFILRLCRNRFHNALNSTLGVDFQMKNLCVDGKTIALQLWDTAGQERFRSIAKSYFRKADGVLLLYDVTCETSFIDVRDWVEAIEDSASKSIPIMLCGNKTDLRESYAEEGKTVIPTEKGEKLAKEYGALFIETSSKENKNITEACIELGRLLRKIEDTEVEESNGLTLAEGDGKNKKKLNCCP